jgi:ABC-type multidrug transport system fused ATPase/permease subunit
MEERSTEKVGDLQKERLLWINKRSKTGAAANTVISLGYWAGYFMAFVWGALKLADKTGTYGTMTVFLQLVNQIQSPFLGLSYMIPQVISAMASAGRLIELENFNKEVPGEYVDIPPGAGIKLKELSFSYDKEENVLNEASMEAGPGEIVALVGPSGEGKTTVLRLLLALMKPDTGEITCYDTAGHEYQVSSSLRKWFSYVPQGNTLFSGTIAENLRSGYPEANEEEMRNALEAACAWDFVGKLPEGLNTVIGEKAHGLSEGQAQRIAIARAFLRKAPIIILDEATSALNIEIEERLLKNIRSHEKNHTCIMITHRRTSLDICDKVYRIDEGKLTLESA